MPILRRSLVSVAVAAMALGGCAAQVNTGSPTTSCSPSFEPGNGSGRLSVQQRSPGQSLQWGFYPNVPVSSFVVDVYMGSRRVDHKSQSYPPHGSVNKVDVKAGSTFRLTGEATNPKGDVLVFGLQCRA
ncbi:MAG TPA: hypothetical protein VF661_08725 [Actinomycetales bacterium]